MGGIPHELQMRVWHSRAEYAATMRDAGYTLKQIAKAINVPNTQAAERILQLGYRLRWCRAAGR